MKEVKMRTGLRRAIVTPETQEMREITEIGEEMATGIRIEQGQEKIIVKEGEKTTIKELRGEGNLIGISSSKLRLEGAGLGIEEELVKGKIAPEEETEGERTIVERGIEDD